jgi:hypothetical protein
MVEVEAYSYGVSYIGKGPLFAYHWHPHRHRTQPHFHIKQGEGFLGMNKLHFPSGHVAIEAVVRFLIEEMAIPSARPDWQSVLDENQKRFEADRARN